MYVQYVNMLLNIIIIISFAGIIIKLFRKNTPNEDEDDNIAEFITATINDAIAKTAAEIDNSIHNSIIKTLYNEANIQNLKNMLTDIIMSAVPSLPSFSSSETTDEEINDAKKIASNAMINSMMDQIPFFDQIASNFLGEDWQQQAQENPKKFMLVFQQLQNLGILNWIQSLSNPLNKTVSQQKISSGF